MEPSTSRPSKPSRSTSTGIQIDEVEPSDIEDTFNVIEENMELEVVNELSVASSEPRLTLEASTGVRFEDSEQPKVKCVTASKPNETSQAHQTQDSQPQQIRRERGDIDADSDEPEPKSMRVALARCFMVQLKNRDDINIEVNEEHAPMALVDPVTHEDLLLQYFEDKLKEGMNDEVSRIEEFNVKGDIFIENIPDPDSAWQNALDFTWVHKWKGSSVRSRWRVRGFNQKMKISMMYMHPHLSSVFSRSSYWHCHSIEAFRCSM